MADPQAVEVPQTLEGWYVLHDVYSIDWARWRAVPRDQQQSLAHGAAEWVATAASVEKGDTAVYSMISQKGDVLFLHYRESPEAINQVELSLRQSPFFDFLRPSYSYFAVIELGLYELTAMARKKLADQGIHSGSEAYERYFEIEMEKQKQRVQTRLFRKVPEERYLCFYPMNKRRGESVNWYTLSIEERRDMMRGHGRIGHKYHETVTQIIGGSIGLDDWEWGVSLHSNDMLTFKKLIYEMRFDPASALYAEFGPFYLGIRRTAEELSGMLLGTVH